VRAFELWGVFAKGSKVQGLSEITPKKKKKKKKEKKKKKKKN
jgi:hypothetical protein